MTACDEEMVLSHTALLATIDARSKSNTKRLDSLDRLVDSIHELTIGFTKLVVNVEQQSKDLTIMVRTLWLTKETWSRYMENRIREKIWFDLQQV